MNKLKAGLVAATTLAVGVVTLRAIRKQRTTPRDEAKTAAEAALGETREAVEHAVAAAGHARVAGGKTLEYAHEEVDSDNPGPKDAEDVSFPEPIRRLRKVGKGWIRQ